jgi:hypothetical protein
MLSATLVLILVSLACGGQLRATAPTETPAATAVPPTVAATSRPTSSPEPAATLEPTAAPIGVAVIHGSLEITVLAALSRPTMHIGDVQGRHYVYYTPPAGKRLIDVAVLVHNLTPGKPVAVKWNNVYITESSGDSWYPYWAKVKTVDANSIADPYSIGISSDEVAGDASLEFADYTYLRLVWILGNDPAATLVFGIQDSPPIAFQVK